jgi:geranylgeranyl reductase family protein
MRGIIGTMINHTRTRDYFSVIVVGAGPAGATAAYELARRGIDVLILERAKLPRYKLCGGGVTWRAVKQLPFDISPVVHKTLRQVTLLKDGSPKVTLQYDKPLVCMTMRDELDWFLTSRARDQGAKLIDGESVTQITESEQGFQIETHSNSFHCQVVVGADGAHSKVAHALGLRRQPVLGLGLEAEILIPAEQMGLWQDSLYVDFGRLRRGYGWIFPKRDHLSIGAAAEGISYHELRNYYDRFVAEKLGTEQTCPRPLGHFLPLRKRNMPLQSGRALLVGDAAGLVDPLTGEGIFYAIRSAQIASTEIAQLLARGQTDLEGYQRRVDTEFMPDLASSLFISHLLSAMPGLALASMAHSQTLQRHLCQIIRGENSSSDTARLFGPLRFLFNFAGQMIMPQHRVPTG